MTRLSAISEFLLKLQGHEAVVEPWWIADQNVDSILLGREPSRARLIANVEPPDVVAPLIVKATQHPVCGFECATIRLSESKGRQYPANSSSWIARLSIGCKGGQRIDQPIELRGI
jgi:hypothetical protein